MIRILLVDDQNIMRQGLQALLESNPKLKVVGTAEDGESAIKQVGILKPDVVLIDIEMPGMSGITATHKICQQFPKTKVLVLSSHENQKYVTKALQAGAKGYLPKSTLTEDLEQAICLVYQGHSQIESRLLKKELVGVAVSQSTTSVSQNGTSSTTKQLADQTSFKLPNDTNDISDINDKYFPKIGASTRNNKNELPSKINKAIFKPAFERTKYLMKFALNKNRRLSIVLIMAVVVAGGIVTNFLIASKPAQTSAANTVKKPTIPNFVAATGYIEPKGEVIKVSSAIADGRVEQLLVKRGELVKAQQTIAILDSRDRLQGEFKQAESQVAIARAKLNQVKAGAKTGEITAQNARLEKAKAEKAGQITSQKAIIASLEAQLQGETSVENATIERIKAELVNAQAECQRYQSLLADGAVSISKQDGVCLQAKIAQESLKESEANLNRITTSQTQKIIQAKADLQRTVTTVDRQITEGQAELEAVSEIRTEDLELAQAELLEAEAGVQKAKANLNLAYVKAPSDGTILEINTLPGEIIDSKGIVELGQTDQMYVLAEIYETDVSRLKIGQPVTVTSNGILQNELQGKVAEKGWLIGTKDILGTDPVADVDSRVVRVKIRLNPEDSKQVESLSNLEVDVKINVSDS
jgi:HlyD family secretion protein